MNKILSTASLVLCSIVAIYAQQVPIVQQAEQSSPQLLLPQQEQQFPQQVQQPQVQQPLPQAQPVQPHPPLPPPPQAQQFLPPPQVQQPPPPPPPQLQQQVQQPQQVSCPPCTAKQKEAKIGLQARFDLNNVSYGFNSKENDKVGVGIGFGGSLVWRTPITNSLDVNPEIGFFYRNLYSEKLSIIDSAGQEGTRWNDETEFVLSIIPVLAQFTPFEVPFYIAVGFEVDFPILAKLTITDEKDGEPKEKSRTFDDRAGYDLGVVWGLGYNITERFSFNFRSVISLTSVTGKRQDARTNNQYGLGVTFF